MAVLGDILYRAASVWQRLAGNTTSTRQFLSQTGTGAVSAAPSWAQVTDADLSTSNITTNNVTIAKHGFAPILPNDATKFLDGTGAYSTPTGAGSVTTTGSPASGNLTKFSGTTSITNADLTGDVTTSGTVGTTIAANAVTTSKITNAAVTLAKIANAASSSVLVGSGASGSGSAYVEIALGTNLSMSGTTLNAAGGGGGGTVTTTGSPATGQRTVFSGATSITGVNAASRPQGRLTLTTGVPWMVATATAQTTIYYTPAEGNIVPIYNGTNWLDTAFTELSQLTTDTTKSPAAVANNSNYDLFVWSDSGTLRCTRGPLWSSDTARGTGAGTTELEFVNGVLMNKNSITNGPAADRGVYVGSVRSNGSAQIDLIFGGSGAAGGESTNLGLWNMYNRRVVTLANVDNTNTWTYTTATIRLKNAGASSTANRITFLIGYQGDGLTATNGVQALNSTTLITQIGGIGVNSTTAFAIGSFTSQLVTPTPSATVSGTSHYEGMAPLGFNYVAPLEWSVATGTTTWYGDNGALLTYSCFMMTTMF